LINSLNEQRMRMDHVHANEKGKRVSLSKITSYYG
jgi:hypothetical protein